MGRYTSRPDRWERDNYRFFPLLSFCMLAPVGFFIIAGRTRCKKWLVEGCLYLLFFIVLLALVDHVSDTILTVLSLIAYFLPIIRTFWVQSEYLQRLEAMENGVPFSPEQQTQTTASPQQGESFKRKEETETAPNHSSSFQGSGESAPAKQDAEVQPTDKLDINLCTPDKLAEMPGISIVQAKKAIDHREQIHGYQNLEEFYEFLSVKSHFRSQLDQKLICEKPASKERAGRKLDL